MLVQHVAEHVAQYVVQQHHATARYNICSLLISNECTLYNVLVGWWLIYLHGWLTVHHGIPSVLAIHRFTSCDGALYQPHDDNTAKIALQHIFPHRINLLTCRDVVLCIGLANNVYRWR